MTDTVNINNALDRIADSISKELQAIVNESPRILLGYNNVRFSARYNRILTNLEAVNSFMDHFIIFLPGKDRTFELFCDEILPMLSKPESVDLQLREKYMEHTNFQIQVTGGRLKKSYLLQAIDFTSEEESVIKNLVDLSARIKAHRIESYDADWFDTEEGKFVFTEEHKLALREEYRRFLTSDEFQEILALELTAQGFNQMLDSGYKFNQFGISTHSALYKNLKVEGLDINRPRFSINMEGFLGSLTELESVELKIELLGKDESGRLLLRVNDQFDYVLTTDKFRLGHAFAHLSGADGITDLKALIEQSQLERVYEVVNYLIKVRSEVLQVIESEEAES